MGLVLWIFADLGKFWSALCLSFRKINVLYCSPQQVLWRWAWCSWCSIWKGLFEDDFQFGSLEARERHLSYLRVTRTKWPFLATATHWASQFEADTKVWVDSKTKTENTQLKDETKYSLCCPVWFDLIYIAFVQLVKKLCSNRLSVLRGIIVGQETNFKSWSEWHEKCDSTRIKL